MRGLREARVLAARLDLAGTWLEPGVEAMRVVRLHLGRRSNITMCYWSSWAPQKLFCSQKDRRPCLSSCALWAYVDAECVEMALETKQAITMVLNVQLKKIWEKTNGCLVSTITNKVLFTFTFVMLRSRSRP
jgi:hypothetical protein